MIEIPIYSLDTYLHVQNLIAHDLGKFYLIGITLRLCLTHSKNTPEAINLLHFFKFFYGERHRTQSPSGLAGVPQPAVGLLDPPLQKIVSLIVEKEKAHWEPSGRPKHSKPNISAVRET
jgi:hypothetical protein